MKLLYVCRANINRSPVLKYLTDLKEVPGLVTDSAGIEAILEHDVTDEMRGALVDAGFSQLKGHKAKSVNSELILNSDIVLCMSGYQEKYLKKKFGDVNTEIYSLPRFVGNNASSVTDPNDLICDENKSFLSNLYDRIFNGFVDYRDYEGRMKLHTRVIKELDMYVENVVEIVKQREKRMNKF